MLHIHSHSVERLQDQFGVALPEEQEELSGLKARMSSRLLPFRDPNGFRKLIVLLTEPGAAPALTSSQTPWECRRALKHSCCSPCIS